MRRTRPTCLAIGALLLVSSVAEAEPTKEEVRRADELFREGRAMMAAGKFPDACSKIEESARLAGGLGTLINLGACHERSGKHSLAYGVFTRAAIVAHDAGRFDREKEATERASALLAMTGRVRVASQAGEEAALTCDGKAPPPLEKYAFVIDTGTHTCEVRVAGAIRWSGLVKGVIGETVTIEVPVAAPVVLAPARPAEQPQSSAPPAASPQDGPSARVVVGWTLVGVGIAGLGISGIFALRASSKDDDAASHCDASGCDANGVALGDEAKSAGNVATVAAIGGSALIAGGLVLVFLLRPSRAAASSARVAPFAGAGGGGLGVSGRF